MYETVFAVTGGLMLGVAFVIICRLIRCAIDLLCAEIETRRTHWAATADAAHRQASQARYGASLSNPARDMDCTPLSAPEAASLERLMR